nr:hypothetical protein [Mycobacteroides saopaulense]
MKKSTKGGNVDAKFAGFKADGGNEHERFWTMSFPPEAQFQRLLAAANDKPDELAWINVVDPPNDFKTAQVGEIIAWECDVDIDHSSRLGAKGGAGVQVLGIISRLVTAGAAGTSILGAQFTPDQAAIVVPQMDELQRLLDSLNITRIGVGRDVNTDWAIYGSLYDDHLRAENIDSERLIVVGKIKRIVPQGEYRRLINTEALSMLQAMQKNGSYTADAPDQFQIRGPALELDIVAIYR